MANVSPSSGKVNDFLSGLSDLSQKRLKEDQDRQRRLQRNVEELRLKLASTSPEKSSYNSSFTLLLPLKNSADNYSLLKFNRDFGKSSDINLVDNDDENPPALPTRPESKKSPPQIPTKSKHLAGRKEKSFNINLVTPVAKPIPKPKELVPTTRDTLSKPTSVEKNKENNSLSSFTDMERGIKLGVKLSSALETDELKPKLPKRPEQEKYSDSSENDEGPPLPKRPTPQAPKKMESFKQPPPIPKKPVEKDENLEFLLQLERMKAPKSTEKQLPRKPVKPSFDSFAKKDSELLQKTKSNLTAKKAPLKPNKPSLKTYEENDTKELLQQKQKMDRRRLEPPAKEEPPSEGLLALQKLKHVDRKGEKPRLPQKPSKSIDKESAQLEQKDSDALSLLSLTSTTPNSFQNQLSSILRAGSAPNMHTTEPPPVAKISRPATVPSKSLEGPKLEHSNKSRAKGPKRRLPKSIKSPSEPEPENSETTPPKSLHQEPPKISTKTKKTPPPINKASKPNPPDVKRRVLTDDVFI